jgi:GTP cyclohydrolase I
MSRVVDEVIDREAAINAIFDLLVALGRDPSSAHLAETPRRVAEALAELLTLEPFDLTTFPNDEHYDELVLVRDIPFRSLCEHHLLPFHGVAHVGYLPSERILGLSKLARVVDHFAADLQTQERLTMQVAGWLDDHLRPKGIGVVMEADHMCMSLRGARAVPAHSPRRSMVFFETMPAHARSSSLSPSGVGNVTKAGTEAHHRAGSPLNRRK